LATSNRSYGLFYILLMRYVVSVLSMIQSNAVNADRSMLLPETATMTTKTKATARTVFIFTSYLGRAPVVTNNYYQLYNECIIFIPQSSCHTGC